MMVNKRFLKNLFFISSLFFASTVFSQQVQPNTDFNKSVRIGSQVWMSENLDVSVFRNGDPIPQVFSAWEWHQAAKNKQPACISPRLLGDQEKPGYGMYYNWFAVADPRGLAPQGWHIPNSGEWQTLIDVAGGVTLAGKALKSSVNWLDEKNKAYGNGTDMFGFRGIPTGVYYTNTRGNKGVFNFEYKFSAWWTSTSKNESEAWLYFFRSEFDGAGAAARRKSSGMPVRCVKD
jgi:uncharacterized protein (TIGR02145 family)